MRHDAYTTVGHVIELPEHFGALLPAQSNLLRVSLKDPDSARFGGINAARTAEGQIYVCGFVNGKNSFGGYTGNKPYLGILNGKVFAVVGMGGTDIETAAVFSECRRYGLNI